MEQKIQNKIFVFEIIASELGSLNCLYEDKDTFHRYPMSKQAIPRFGMSTRESFSNQISLPVTNKYHKGAVMQISTLFVHVYHIAC